MIQSTVFRSLSLRSRAARRRCAFDFSAVISILHFSNEQFHDVSKSGNAQACQRGDNQNYEQMLGV